MEGVEHLEYPLGRVFADVNAAAENFARRFEHDQLHVLLFADMGNAVGNFAKEVFVEKIVLGAIQRHAGDARIDLELQELKIGGLAAFWFRANLDATTGYGVATHFHGGFSFRESAKIAAKSDGSMWA
jgi:hypothetical protein